MFLSIMTMKLVFLSQMWLFGSVSLALTTGTIPTQPANTTRMSSVNLPPSTATAEEKLTAATVKEELTAATPTTEKSQADDTSYDGNVDSLHELTSKRQIPSPTIVGEPAMQRPDTHTMLGRTSNVGAEVNKLMTSGYIFFPHVYRAFIAAGKSPENYSISGQCGLNLVQYYKALQKRRGWAWNMYDSTGKQGAGLLTGSLHWRGNVQQCLNKLTYRPKHDEFTDGGEIPAQFCTIYIGTPSWVKKFVKQFNLPFRVPLSPFIGDVCTVSGCTEEDIQSLMQQFINEKAWRGKLTVTAVKCKRDRDILRDPAALLSLGILCLLLLLSCIGAAYDVFHIFFRDRVRGSIDIAIGEDTETASRYAYITPIESEGHRSHAHKGHTRKNVRPSTVLKVSHLNSINSENYHDATHDRTETNGGSSTAPPAQIDIRITPDEDIFIPSSIQQSNRPEQSPPRHNNDLNSKAGPISSFVGTGTISEGNKLRAGGAATVNTQSSSLIHGIPGSPGKDISATASEFGDVDGGKYTNTCRQDEEPCVKSDTYQEHPVISQKSYNVFRMQRRQMSLAEAAEKRQSAVNLLRRILFSFSFRRNLVDILGRGHPDILFCLNGLRACSIGWIVLGSYYHALYTNPSILENNVDAVNMARTFWIQPFINTTLAADTFFIMSGTLYAYHFVRKKLRSKEEKKMTKVLTAGEYFTDVIHRLARFTPCYYATIMIYVNLGPYINVGLESPERKIPNPRCQDHWWANVLFISNFYKADEMCMPWTYYLCDDFQLFLFSPVVLVPMLCYPVLGFVLIGALVGVQILTVMLINTGINGNVMRMGENNYFSRVYVKPYCRMAGYVMGLGLGYLLSERKNKIRLRTTPLFLGWSLTLAVVVILPYFTYLEYKPGGYQWTGVQTSLFEALSRPIWALAVSWVIFTSCNGQGGFVSKLLSWNIFLPICRITYGVYLLHPMVIEAVLTATDTRLFVTFTSVTFNYLAILTSCWCLSLFFIVIVQEPLVRIEALVLRHLHAKRS